MRRRLGGLHVRTEGGNRGTQRAGLFARAPTVKILAPKLLPHGPAHKALRIQPWRLLLLALLLLDIWCGFS